MAEGGTIYTKTIDPSVQDGIDNNLIIQPNYAYQKKFGFGDDWTEIKIGMFMSFTNSVTLDNQNFVSGVNYDSGGTTNDTFSFFGVIEDKAQKFIPGDASGGSFIGNRFNKTVNVSSSLNTSLNKLADNEGNQDGLLKVTYNNSLKLGNNTGDINNFHMPYTEMGNTTGFAVYIGAVIKIVDRGLSTQSILIRNYYKSGTDSALANQTTDISLLALKNLMNGNDHENFYNASLPFNEGGNPVNIPDSFFFYNAFLDIRPRIHALAVKKIS